MVAIFFDMHDERHAAFVFARQALDTTVGIEHGVQLAQVTPRKADINAVAYNGDKHVFPTSPCVSCRHRTVATTIVKTARIVAAAAGSRLIVWVATAPPISVARHTAAARVS